jgi:hypothetical protein
MEKRDVFFISVLYIAAYSIMLIVKGYFWDDWTFFNINEKIAIDQFFENGNIWFGYYIKFLFYIEAHYFPARLFTFFAYLFSTILLYGILRNINLFDSTSRFFIVAFFALFPVNTPRIVITPCAAYGVCNLMFFLGFYFVTKYLTEKKIMLRILSHLCFFTAFFMNSILVFYVVVLAYLLYI